MTLVGLILSDKLFSQGISNKLKYITLGTLFINISVGGTLTNFEISYFNGCKNLGVDTLYVYNIWLEGNYYYFY